MPGPQVLERVVECPLITYQPMADHSRTSFQIHAGTYTVHTSYNFKKYVRKCILLAESTVKLVGFKIKSIKKEWMANHF
jgi:hypothetical protein